ncbi:D-2-hydroxyacid dehydrogenase family protein [Actinomadura sp. KC216]|uniref:D-2-hydroxyacid dehydrogenase family protein n=1 Tax=Actinomadura sp. KC216 TaxID=2530370 RepID=UPI0010504094|nr:D-2-hydroxyacid dehydrogenase family protein [Actinomadura sp. KC216]TDB91624.1 D-2-hydroxyacid dehydrogenase family protein [Actinomadura sp. KC216]
MRVAILDDYQGVALRAADWSPVPATIDVFRAPLGGEETVVAALQPYEVLVTMRDRTALPKTVLERLPNLRLIVVTGHRVAAIDIAACAGLGITVSGTAPVAGGGSAAELTWALILAAVKRLPAELASVRAGGWTTRLGTSLTGRTLGVLGLGRLGSQVAAVGHAFGMRVVAWSQNLTAERAAEAGAALVGKEELFATSDVVTIHLVLSDRTRGLVGEPELRRMKPDAWLVNTSRGPICDEDALLRACRERWIAGAALDVYDREPLPADHPLRTLDNVLATPHIGYVTEETYASWYSDAVENIVAYTKGSPIRVRHS